MRRAALACVLPFDAVTPDAGFGAPYDAPRFPGSLSASRECDGWWTLYTPQGATLNARVVGRNGAGTAVAMTIHGPAAIIRAIADASAKAWTLAELRADGGALAQRVKQLLAQRGPATIAGYEDDAANEDGT